MSELIGVWVGAILTLLVFSYLLGDTPLFRLAQAIFIGVAVGYATTVAIHLVLIPQLFEPLAMDPEKNGALLVPLILGILLMTKLRTAWAPFGNVSVAFLFGVGGALAIGGALSGVLLPQFAATALTFASAQGSGAAVNGLLLVLGTIGALLSFHFVTGGERPAARVLDRVAYYWGYAGRWFILIAFGAIFADTAVSRISVLIGRVYFLLHNWLPIVR